ncbi:uncharacterized protein KQ657_003483, partial [Scheffersomyces spartinae]
MSLVGEKDNKVDVKTTDSISNEDPTNYVNFFIESAKESENADKTMTFTEGIK